MQKWILLNHMNIVIICKDIMIKKKIITSNKLHLMCFGIAISKYVCILYVCSVCTRYV